MRAVGKTPNEFKFIRIPSHNPKNIQEGSAEIICEDIDILSHPKDAAFIVKTKPNSNLVQPELRLDTKLTANAHHTTPPHPKLFSYF